uniref:AATF leucine zipper-containing domain-containing protein n=1 Tax=Lygus hesperus TaxID=30085 RepID=A0A0K8S609_LYGHE
MSLRKEIEKSLRTEDTEVDAVEDHVMKDSVLEIASADFKEQDVLDLPLTSRKRSGADVGADYPGKPISRKKYGQDVGVALEETDSESVDDGDGEEEPESDNELEDGLMGIEDESAAEEEDQESEDDEDLEEEEESSEDVENESAMVGPEEEGEEVSSPMKMFSTSSTESLEIQKGLAVREQLRIWESLLESRIKFEPALVAANQLYQRDKMTAFISNEKSSGSTDIDSVLRALQELSSSWSRLQEALGGQSVPKPSNKRKSVMDVENDDSDDESIRSSEASENLSEDDVSDAERKEIKSGPEDAGEPPK